MSDEFDPGSCPPNKYPPSADRATVYVDGPEHVVENILRNFREGAQSSGLDSVGAAAQLGAMMGTETARRKRQAGPRAEVNWDGSFSIRRPVAADEGDETRFIFELTGTDPTTGDERLSVKVEGCTPLGRKRPESADADADADAAADGVVPLVTEADED